MTDVHISLCPSKPFNLNGVSMRETYKQETFSEMLTREWLKYDKNITSVLRTMGFNSMAAFNKSNSLKEHYFMIFKELGTDPKKGLLGLSQAMNKIQNSVKYKSLLWIEHNASRYDAYKNGSEKVKELASAIENRIQSLSSLPHVINVKVFCRAEKNVNASRMEDQIDNNFRISVYYDPKLTVTKKYQYTENDFTLHFNTPIIQRIRASIDGRIVNLDYEDANEDDVMKLLFNKESLRNSFAFTGPSPYISSSNTAESPSPGCLGTLQEDFLEIIERGNIESYLNFIGMWSGLITDESNPYRQPGELLRHHQLLGFSSEDAIKFVKNEYENFYEEKCAIWSLKTELLNTSNAVAGTPVTSINYRIRNRCYSDNSVLRYTVPEEGNIRILEKVNELYCSQCVAVECNLNPNNHKDKLSSVDEVGSMKKMMDEKDIHVAMVLHNHLISNDHRNLPIDAQIRCLLDDDSYAENDYDKAMYKSYKHTLSEKLIPWDQIKSYWEKKYEK